MISLRRRKPRSQLPKCGSVIAVAGLSLVGSFGYADAANEFAGMTLTVLGINTDINQVWMKSFGEQFERDTGATLNIITGSAPGNLSKLLVAKGHMPNFQVLLLDNPTQADAIQAHAIQTLDYSKMPNVQKVVKQGFPAPGYGPAVDFYRLGTCINVAQYKAHNIPIPTSVEGWFNPALRGHVILPAPDNFWWLTGMHALAENFKVPLSDPTRLFKMLADIHPASLFSASGQAQAELQSGQAWLAPTSDGRCFALKMGGQPMDFVPLNLSIGGKTYPWAYAADTWEVPVGVEGKQLALAYKFIDYSVAPKAEVLEAKKFGYFATTEAGMALVEALPDIQRAQVYKGFSFGAMYTPDAQKLLPYKQKWLAIWNQTFSQ